MSNGIYIMLLITWFANTELFAQTQRFIVKEAPFSSRLNDEFSPVFYNGGIVFCSNQSGTSLIGYKNEQNRLFKIFFVEKSHSKGWKHPKILAKEITSVFNDGPVTFGEDENIIFYSRNNSIENTLKNIADTSNKLGIYSAEINNGIWTNIKPFTYNNPLYSFCTPALAPDGDRIFFSSDIPGGSGGMDLYYCNWRNGDWDRPVNMGPAINTPGNESFPFACKSGKLFFASDGHNGFGGKDLFYTQEINGAWIFPEHLDSAINSTADDFGLVADSTGENGYFSTNRLKTDDIFSFSLVPEEFADCDSLKENNYCFTFYDEKQQLIDSLSATYQWDFGDGIKHLGIEVKHCFPGPGEYSVKLSIIDELTGKAIADQVDYKVELENIEQAYINSYNVGLVNTPISFDGAKTNLKGFRIKDYLWNVGDGFKPGGPFMCTKFTKKGEYTVQLGVLAEKDSLRITRKTCVKKNVKIYDTYEGMVLNMKNEENELNKFANPAGEQNKALQIRIYFMDDLFEKQKEIIREAMSKTGNFTIKFDQFGIVPASYSLLDHAGEVLKENPDIRLEIVLHTMEIEKQSHSMEVSEKWAQELAFYLKNKEINRNALSSKGFGFSYPVFKPVVPYSKSFDGIAEFIFIKN
jgi:outer membrane protein OmpA-like peptidoglycan-associated protein